MALTSEKSTKSKFNQPNIQYCRYCGKECKSINSLKQHECRCKENPDRIAYNNLGEYVTKTRKGTNKYTNKDVAKQSNALKLRYDNGYISPHKGKGGTFKGKHHTEETKKKISESTSKSRLKGYSNGTITPAKGVGRGMYSYIQYNNRTYMLRSTYEFIYALYLIHNDVEFELESIRVPAVRKNKYVNTFISDFSIGNEIVEIKGVRSLKDIYERESFESAGYSFKELYKDDIMAIKKQLIDFGYDIDGLLSKIRQGHKAKQYFVYCVGA